MRPHRAVPLGLAFHFTERAELLRARRILLDYLQRVPVSLIDWDFIDRMFGRPIRDAEQIRMLLDFIEYELRY